MQGGSPPQPAGGPPRQALSEGAQVRAADNVSSDAPASSRRRDCTASECRSRASSTLVSQSGRPRRPTARGGRSAAGKEDMRVRRCSPVDAREVAPAAGRGLGVPDRSPRCLRPAMRSSSDDRRSPRQRSRRSSFTRRRRVGRTFDSCPLDDHDLGRPAACRVPRPIRTGRDARSRAGRRAAVHRELVPRPQTRPAVRRSYRQTIPDGQSPAGRAGANLGRHPRQ